MVPGTWEIYVAHRPCNSSYLDWLLLDMVVMVSEEAEDKVPTISGQEFPPLDLEGGPHSYYPDVIFINYMERNAKYIGTKFWIQDPFFAVRSKHIESVLTTHVRCVYVYH